MTTPARPTPKAIVAALVTEIMEEARKNAEQPAPSKSRAVPTYIAAGLVFALCAWAWIAPPAWLVPQPVAAPSRAYREASTRVALALHAQRIVPIGAHADLQVQVVPGVDLVVADREDAIAAHQADLFRR